MMIFLSSISFKFVEVIDYSNPYYILPNSLVMLSKQEMSNSNFIFTLVLYSYI